MTKNNYFDRIIDPDSDCYVPGWKILSEISWLRGNHESRRGKDDPDILVFGDQHVLPKN